MRNIRKLEDLPTKVARLEREIDSLKSKVSGKLGYQYGGQVIYKTTDTFDKADYPGLKAIRVKVQAGGGGGGGAATTTASQSSGGEGGGAGGYAEAFVEAADLSTSEAVSVGSGGGGGTAGSAGSAGSSSALGSHASASGGSGGAIKTTTATIQWAGGGNAGIGTVGDLLIEGERGGGPFNSTAHARGGFGGSSFVSPDTQRAPDSNASNGVTAAATSYGCGGSGGANQASQGANRTGGSGAAGIVIIELYY